MSDIYVYIIYGVILVLSNIGSILLSQYRNNKKMCKGIQMLLRLELEEIFFRCIKKKYATPKEKADFEVIFEVYHNLGSNGVMNAYREQLLKLPNK